MRVSGPVAAAIAGRRPVVALETTLVTHGLPRPVGLGARRSSSTLPVRERGAVPATIGLLDGAVRVGLSPDELERLAAPPTPDKINLSNLAAHLACGARGSTTVAATMLLAHRAGIAVIATGGIGGVHRGAAESGDVSADLTALARLPVAVVCSGAKAILDLPRTVEMLETLGVPVLGFGTDELPAFYRRSSGLPIDARCDDVATLAGAIETHFALGTGTGVVVANPIPAASELAEDLNDRALAAALARRRGGGRARPRTHALSPRALRECDQRRERRGQPGAPRRQCAARRRSRRGPRRPAPEGENPARVDVAAHAPLLLLARALPRVRASGRAAARPNVVVILVDDLRWDDFGFAAIPSWRRPRSIASRARASRFLQRVRDHAAVLARAAPAILTGQYVHTNGIIDNTARDAASHRLPTFAIPLADAGYRTGFFGKWHMGNDDTPAARAGRAGSR